MSARPVPAARRPFPTRAPLAAGLAMGLVTASAACGGSGAAEPPALTRDEARAVLGRYEAAVGQAGQRLDAAALPAVETDPQLAMDTAAVRLRRAVGQRTGPLKFASTAFYIPRVAGYPRWFAVEAVTGAGRQALRHALLFTQARAGGPWLLAADPYPGDAVLRNVELDDDAYAVAVPPDAPGLAVAPGRIAAAHAALLTGGPQAPGATALAPGPRTDQAHTALRQGVAALGRRGITFTSTFTPAALPVYALRTRDGGAVVWYALRQNEGYSSAKKGRLTVSGDLTGLVPARSVKNRMTTTVLIQYLATIPPKGKANVTGMYRKAVSASPS
ncbi:hypothetical protein ACSNOI_20235 [Actinomadura kijaniata]|uniref:hypothetical protein n=1 Tax=Actinomadura kijaniata TaxID=46161 RepID=UPI003F1CDEE4